MHFTEKYAEMKSWCWLREQYHLLWLLCKKYFSIFDLRRHAFSLSYSDLDPRDVISKLFYVYLNKYFESDFVAAYNSLFSSASKGSPQQKSSPKSTSRSQASSSSSSAKTTITKATTTIATNTTSSCTNSISKKTFTTPVVAGTTGVSLLSGKVKKSPGRSQKGDSASLSQSSSKSNGSIVSSPSYSTSSASGLFSPPTQSALNASSKQQVIQ